MNETSDMDPIIEKATKAARKQATLLRSNSHFILQQSDTDG